jgi:hypothetical protein
MARLRGLVLAGWGVARVALVSLCVVACGTVWVSSAGAAPAQFGEEGSGAGQLLGPRGIAVEQESGDVYVADTGHDRMEKFGPGGEFLLAWGWGVADGTTPALQTCTVTCFAGIEGSGAGQFASRGSAGVEGVAVDNDPLSASHGDVYVIDSLNRRVEKFTPEGEFVLTFGAEVNRTAVETPGATEQEKDLCTAASGDVCQAGVPSGAPGGFEQAGGRAIAVDAAGSVYVGDNERVQRFSQGGVLEGHFAVPGAVLLEGLAVDSGGGVYVEAAIGLAGVHKYDIGGIELGAPRDEAGFPQSIALGAGDELFVVDGQVGAGHAHVLGYDAAGNQLSSFDANGAGGTSGIAYGAGVEALYLLERVSVRVLALPAPGPLLVTGGAASQIQPTTATLGATVNPEGRETTYSFEYGTSTAYGASTPSATLEGNFNDLPASADLSGLQPRTAYHFRIVASNAAGTVTGPDETFTTLPPASIDSESASQVTSNSVVLSAQVNPLGRDTHYRFEYGATAAYGASVPVPDGDAGAGTVDVALSAPVGGLAPGTVYHYRVVATNALGTVEGADRVLRTQAAQAPGLPDGRAWEMVSPPDKHGALLEPLSPPVRGLIQAADNGGGITYLATGPVDREPAGNRSFLYTQVLSTRGADGWASRGITTANEAPEFCTAACERGESFVNEYKLFSGDLSVGLVQPEGETPLSPAASERTVYLRESDGEYLPLVTAANVPPGTTFGSTEHSLSFVGASPDMTHVLLDSREALTPGFTSGGLASLYEWTGGSLQLVSVLPNEKPAAEEGDGAELGREKSYVWRAMSDDGERVVWMAEGGGGTRLYLRDLRLGGTVQLDTPEAGAAGGGGVPLFQAASSDGSKVFFTDTARLTRDAKGGPPGGADLYMCEVGEAAGKPTCRLKDLTIDETTGKSANMEGIVLGAGDDGRYLYFVSDGVLAPGATQGDCAKEHSGAPCNLYVYDAATGTRRLVATLANEDGSDWQSFNVSSPPIEDTVRVSPSGRYLAFMSQKSLTGYDNVDARSGQPDTEVFLYDASANSVRCASCNPTGARPTGVFDTEGGLLVDTQGASGWHGHWLAGSIPGWENQGINEYTWYQPRYLSNSGRLFFNSADALVAGDTNGLEDVYEYESGGVGSCTDAAGCVGLISSGKSGEESAFLDASESGDDVFFLTSARLVGQDVDGELDVYDARVCTASSPCLASVSASSPVSCASGDSCRGSGSPGSGVFGAPSSTAVSGAGNIAAAAPVKPVVKARRLSRAQKLASALRSCRKKAKRRRRVSCEARARRTYGKGAKVKQAGRARATSKNGR